MWRSKDGCVWRVGSTAQSVLESIVARPKVVKLAIVVNVVRQRPTITIGVNLSTIGVVWRKKTSVHSEEQHLKGATKLGSSPLKHCAAINAAIVKDQDA